MISFGVVALASFITWVVFRDPALVVTGTPWGPRYPSAGGKYYVQMYQDNSIRLDSIFDIIPFFPGQGSDGISGYGCLFDSSGKLLAKKYFSSLSFAEPLVGDKGVLFAGDDSITWTLPP